MNSLNFNDKDGLPAVNLFVNWLDKNKKKWRKATQQEQANEIDIITQKQNAEVKTTLKHSQLAIEETSDIGKPGWIYTSKSSVVVFVNVEEKFAWVIPTEPLQKYYYRTKDAHGLFYNKKTIGLRGDEWTSSFRWYAIYDLAEHMTVTRIEL